MQRHSPGVGSYNIDTSAKHVLSSSKGFTFSQRNSPTMRKKEPLIRINDGSVDQFQMRERNAKSKESF
jgi:hypothetical protein